MKISRTLYKIAFLVLLVPCNAYASVTVHLVNYGINSATNGAASAVFTAAGCAGVNTSACGETYYTVCTVKSGDYGDTISYQYPWGTSNFHVALCGKGGYDSCSEKYKVNSGTYYITTGPDGAGGYDYHLSKTPPNMQSGQVLR